LPYLLNLLQKRHVDLLDLEERGLQLLVPPLKALHLEALALARRLRGAAVPEHTFNAALLLLVLGLGAFPGRD
jgi:hypothetical protein